MVLNERLVRSPTPLGYNAFRDSAMPPKKRRSDVTRHSSNKGHPSGILTLLPLDPGKSKAGRAAGGRLDRQQNARLCAGVCPGTERIAAGRMGRARRGVVFYFTETGRRSRGITPMKFWGSKTYASCRAAPLLLRVWPAILSCVLCAA